MAKIVLSDPLQILELVAILEAHDNDFDALHKINIRRRLEDLEGRANMFNPAALQALRTELDVLKVRPAGITEARVSELIAARLAQPAETRRVREEREPEPALGFSPATQRLIRNVVIGVVALILIWALFFKKPSSTVAPSPTPGQTHVQPAPEAPTNPEDEAARILEGK